MSETLSSPAPTESEATNTSEAYDNQQAILAGEKSLDDLSEAELRDIETFELPDREEDVDKARAIADAITGQETAMARSRTVSREVGAQVDALEDQKEGASLIEKFAINTEIKDLERGISEISTDNTDYWDELTAQRDKKAAEAAAVYEAERSAAVDNARADVEAALQPK